MLGFLEKLTLHPEAIKPFDVRALREADISKQAIEDAIYICAFFNIIDRVADALDFNVPSPEVFAHRAEATTERGYRFTSMQK